MSMAATGVAFWMELGEAIGEIHRGSQGILMLIF